MASMFEFVCEEDQMSSEIHGPTGISLLLESPLRKVRRVAAFWMLYYVGLRITYWLVVTFGFGWFGERQKQQMCQQLSQWRNTGDVAGAVCNSALRSSLTHFSGCGGLEVRRYIRHNLCLQLSLGVDSSLFQGKAKGTAMCRKAQKLPRAMHLAGLKT